MVTKKKTTKIKRRERKNVEYGVAHIRSTFNNTIISITDDQGNTISWSSSGNIGFKGSRTVSYTHLDVYKRQPISLMRCTVMSRTTVFLWSGLMPATA